MLDRYTISYAQNREDIIINSFFPDIKNGFYVDIGAYDAEYDSVTKLFYDKGWSGINVEPQPERLAEIDKKRPRDINLNIGIADKNASMVLRSYTNQGWSTFSDQVKKDNSKNDRWETSGHKDIVVETMTLRAVFEKYKIDKIHFMKVDVEGLEYEVLVSNDWSKYRPELICMEADNIIKDCQAVLKKHKYQKVFNDGINDYYLSKESLFRLKSFDYAETFLLNKPVIGAGMVDIIGQQYAAPLKEQNKLLAEQKKYLIWRLSQYTDIKSQAGMLSAAINNKIISKIDSLGRPRKVKTISLKECRPGDKNDTSKILAYDKKSFKQRRLLGSPTRRVFFGLVKFAYLAFYRVFNKVTRCTLRLLRRVRLING